MYIELFPLEKAIVNGQVVPFGIGKSSVEKLLGNGEQIDRKSYYFESNLCIEYDNDSKVAFIETSCAEPDGIVVPTIYGMDISKCDAEYVFQLLREKNNGEIDDSENGYSYTFYNLSVGIYREITPSDYKEMIDEMNSNGISV